MYSLSQRHSVAESRTSCTPLRHHFFFLVSPHLVLCASEWMQQRYSDHWLIIIIIIIIIIISIITLLLPLLLLVLCNFHCCYQLLCQQPRYILYSQFKLIHINQLRVDGWQWAEQNINWHLHTVIFFISWPSLREHWQIYFLIMVTLLSLIKLEHITYLKRKKNMSALKTY